MEGVQYAQSHVTQLHDQMEHTLVRGSQLRDLVSELLVKVLCADFRLDHGDKGGRDLAAVQVFPVDGLKELVTFHLFSICFSTSKSERSTAISQNAYLHNRPTAGLPHTTVYSPRLLTALPDLSPAASPGEPWPPQTVWLET